MNTESGSGTSIRMRRIAAPACASHVRKGAEHNARSHDISHIVSECKATRSGAARQSVFVLRTVGPVPYKGAAFRTDIRNAQARPRLRPETWLECHRC